MKKAITFVAVILLLGSAVVFYGASNLGRSKASIEFSKSDKPGLNTVKITGPYGWKCITYEKSKISPDAKELILSGRGIRDLPLFGASVENTNYFPSEGKLENIPLDEDYLFYKPNDNFECHIIITKDSQRFDSLK